MLVGLTLAAPPTIACPADIDIFNTPGDCGAIVTYAGPIVDDPDGDIVSVTLLSGLASGSLFPVGTTIVEYEVEDSVGNTASCSFTVTVTDNESPMAICQDITITLDATGMATIVANDVDGGSTDNCGIDTITVSQTMFDCSNIGENTVILTVTDVNDNNPDFTQDLDTTSGLDVGSDTTFNTDDFLSADYDDYGDLDLDDGPSLSLPAQPPNVFRTGVSDILFTKGQWIGTLIGGIIDLGSAVGEGVSKLFRSATGNNDSKN